MSLLNIRRRSEIGIRHLESFEDPAKRQKSHCSAASELTNSSKKSVVIICALIKMLQAYNYLCVRYSFNYLINGFYLYQTNIWKLISGLMVSTKLVKSVFEFHRRRK
ncbi:hypothetical protein LIER_09892 [Lithospermum erythrorhizon]|uniref:Uncharacterized protein n=1 Tax=Lithospermum erythrorhizon TaxID=34254 RepID=A0AAV3PL95_LITER